MWQPGAEQKGEKFVAAVQSAPEGFGFEPRHQQPLCRHVGQAVRAVGLEEPIMVVERDPDVFAGRDETSGSGEDCKELPLAGASPYLEVPLMRL